MITMEIVLRFDWPHSLIGDETSEIIEGLLDLVKERGGQGEVASFGQAKED